MEAARLMIETALLTHPSTPLRPRPPPLHDLQPRLLAHKRAQWLQLLMLWAMRWARTSVLCALVREEETLSATQVEDRPWSEALASSGPPSKPLQLASLLKLSPMPPLRRRVANSMTREAKRNLSLMKRLN